MMLILCGNLEIQPCPHRHSYIAHPIGSLCDHYIDLVPNAPMLPFKKIRTGVCVVCRQNPVAMNYTFCLSQIKLVPKSFSLAFGVFVRLVL